MESVKWLFFIVAAAVVSAAVLAAVAPRCASAEGGASGVEVGVRSLEAAAEE